MKFIFSFFTIFLFFTMHAVPDQAVETVTITSDSGFVVSDEHNPHKEKKISDASILLKHDGTQIIINGKATHTAHLILAPVDGKVRVGDKVYNGAINVHLNQQNLTVVHNQPQENPLTLDARLYNVRVLLDEWRADAGSLFSEKKVWNLFDAQGFMVRNPKKEIILRTDTPHLTLTIKKGELTIQGTTIDATRVEIIPVSGLTTFNNNQYKGAFIVSRTNNNFFLMNSLDLEDYVFSVLRTESWPGWPLEINKVMAVACRSYAIAMIMRAKQQKLPYHIKNSNVHQTYSGLHENAIVKQAVQDTKGIFLAYEDKPIIAMFDGCCGGIIPAGIKGFNFSQAPYLKRPYACTHCKDCKIFSWQAEYETSILLDFFKKGVPTLKKIRDIKVAKKDKAGLVQEVSIKGARGHATLSGKKVYSLLKEVKSYCFSVHKKADTIIFKGKGYGHHLGLCQWGAREMVRQGKQYRDILQFYYPNTTFVVLQ